MRIAITGFRGANKALHAKLLPDTGVGAESLNQKPGRGDLRPWNVPLQVATVPNLVQRKTIYRMGRDVPNDASYWLSWTTPVHAMRGFNATDTTEKTYYTGDGPPKWTDNTKALASAPYPTAWRLLGVPAPTTQCVLAINTNGTGTDETRFYVHTFVTDEGEESAPSPVSASLTCKPGAIIDITNLPDAPAGSYGINRRRIYRTQVGKTSTEFYFLREVAIGVTSTQDDARALGEVPPTATWAIPPVDGHGLIPLWNGMASMVSGKSIRYCVPNTLYAWPLDYELLTNDTIVGQAAYGQTQVVLTTGSAYTVTGQEPSSMSQMDLDGGFACVSEASIVSVKHGIVWASPDGLAYTGTAGPTRLLTSGLLMPEDWRALAPTTIVGCQFAGLYFGFYNDGSGLKGFIIDPIDPQGIYFLSTGYNAAFFDTITNALYVLDGGNIKKWDADTSLMVASFKSKVHRAPNPTNFAVAQVVADAFPVTVKLYADGALKITKTVADGSPWNLPKDFLADDWQVEVSCAGAVQGVMLGETVDDLE
jgi:hypothetical protein